MINSIHNKYNESLKYKYHFQNLSNHRGSNIFVYIVTSFCNKILQGEYITKQYLTFVVLLCLQWYEGVIFLVLNTNHIYIQPIGSKERLKTGSSSGISYKKKCEKNDSLSFFSFFCYSPQYYDTLESSCYFFVCARGFMLNYLFFLNWFSMKCFTSFHLSFLLSLSLVDVSLCCF